MKTSKQLERHFKGIANHRRLDILFLIAKNDGINLDEITTALGANIQTMSEHCQRLTRAGLVEKTYEGRSVCHSLSPYGKQLLSLIKTFQHSG